MATQLTPEQQAYYQGLADYEAALHAEATAAAGQVSDEEILQAQMYEAQVLEAQMFEAQIAEAQMLEAQMLEARMLEIQMASGSPDIEAHYAHAIAQYDALLLHQQAALEQAAASMEAAYVGGMVAYEQAMMAEAEFAQAGAAGESGGVPDEQTAYLQGLTDFELELLVKAAGERAAALTPELREAYDKGRADYEKAMAPQPGEGGTEGEAQTDAGGEEASAGESGRSRRRSRSR